MENPLLKYFPVHESALHSTIGPYFPFWPYARSRRVIAQFISSWKEGPRENIKGLNNGVHIK